MCEKTILLQNYNLIIATVVIFFVYNYVCECTVGVDVGDGTTIGVVITGLISITSNIVMRCIVLGGQMNLYFGMIVCTNAMMFVGMKVRFCTMKIHDSMMKCPSNHHIHFIGAAERCVFFALNFYIRTTVFVPGRCHH